MRKLLAIAATAAVATVAFGAAPAQADNCPHGDGTLPNSPSNVYVVGPLYVDDRDSQDLDDDGVAGGFWIYLESGVAAGLQRGGDQVAFSTLKSKGVNPAVPVIKPIVVPVTNPTTGKPVLTLFPEGAGGGDLATTAGEHDDCTTSTGGPASTPTNRDSILL